MASITKKDLDLAVATAVAAALESAAASRDLNKGALWLSKPDGKSDMSGRLDVDGTAFRICAFSTGADGTDKRPVYRLSIFLDTEE